MFFAINSIGPNCSLLLMNASLEMGELFQTYTTDCETRIQSIIINLLMTLLEQEGEIATLINDMRIANKHRDSLCLFHS